MFELEVKAIHEIREQVPAVGQRTLANQIKRRDFQSAYLNDLAAKAANRTYFSVYSVIRRFDKKHRVVA